ncbi:MAG TPA: LysR family transcriptional regulator [Pseudonocardiaceae bacterium]|nr:LysR family transcriptional regulator [Pseudonocardiaceae bacterium]
MNLEGVRAFVAVAEAGQFRIAADELEISQQAVSKRIAALEADVGAVLFRRVPSGAVLTADGQTFLPRARAVLTAVRQAVESVRRDTRPLRIDVISRRIAPAAIVRAFHRGQPTVPVEMITTQHARSMLGATLNGEIDAGFAYLSRPPDRRIDHVMAYLERLQVLVGERHPLAGARTVPAAELGRYRAWMPGIVPGSEWGDYYGDLGTDLGVRIDVTGSGYTEPLLDTIADSRSLITFVGDRTRLAWPDDSGLYRIPVVDPAPVYPHSLFWHAGNRHAGLHRLVDYVRAEWPVTVTDDLWLPSGAR